MGGNDRRIPLPQVYDGWLHVLLDIDLAGEPDVICDARELATLPGAEYDAVYCAHNLEHYYRHDVPRVLTGFLHVLKRGGFAHIRVPDMAEVMRVAVQDGMDIDDVLYESAAGPITVCDVIYGYGEEIERSGNDFYAHKTGFTPRSLKLALARCGFSRVFLGSAKFEIIAYAFPEEPGPGARKLLGLPES